MTASLNPNQHQLAKILFSQVSDLPKSAQIGRLQQLCGDVALIKYVASLLDQADADHPRVAQALLYGLAGAETEAIQVRVGDTLGAWKLVDEVGQGGMGAVFLAQRVDGHFEQTAAVKVLHGVPSAKALEYLARERQILATLTHPNIARLYDGGATPSGQPYLVIEYVDGVSIDRFVAQEKLGLDAILKLVAQVCDAVSFAHQRLIVHCDIKPSNILVGAACRPMLLDFGIARLLDVSEDAASAPTAAFSADVRFSQDPASRGAQTKARAFTPRYASPEQRNGGVLSTATDVFSLGKMLEELLVNALETPVNRASSDMKAGIKANLKLPPLPKELAAIIAKATFTEPHGRYPTANDLAHDIARYLRDEPVMALPATRLYRAKKFSHRNWPWLAAASVFVMAGLFAVQRIVSERNTARQAELVAKFEADKSQRAGAFLTSLFESADPNKSGAPSMTATDLLALGRQRLSETSAEQYEFRTTMLLRLGKIQENIGVFDEAISIYEQVIAKFKTNLKPTPTDFENYARALDWLAVIENNNGRAAKAEVSARESLRVRQNLAVALENAKPSDSAASEAKAAALAVADAQGALGIVLTTLRRGPEALSNLEAALATRKTLLGVDSDGVGSSMNNIGMYYARIEKFELAEAAYRESIAIKRRIYDDPHQPKLLNTLMNLGNLLSQQRRFVEAEPLLREAYKMRIVRHGEKSEKVAQATHFLAVFLQQMGRYDEAKLRYIEANNNASRRPNLGGLRPMPYAETLTKLGTLFDEIGDGEQALKHYEQAREIRRAHVKPDATELAESAYYIGRLLLKMDKLDAAEPELLVSLNIRLKQFSRLDADTQASQLALATLAIKSKNSEAAAPFLHEVDDAAIANYPELKLEKMAIIAHFAAQSSANQGGKLWQARADYARKIYGDNHLIFLRTQLQFAQALSASDKIRARNLVLQIASRIETQLAPSALERKQILTLR